MTEVIANGVYVYVYALEDTADAIYIYTDLFTCTHVHKDVYIYM